MQVWGQQHGKSAHSNRVRGNAEPCAKGRGRGGNDDCPLKPLSKQNKQSRCFRCASKPEVKLTTKRFSSLPSLPSCPGNFFRECRPATDSDFNPGAVPDVLEMALLPRCSEGICDSTAAGHGHVYAVGIMYSREQRPGCC